MGRRSVGAWLCAASIALVLAACASTTPNEPASAGAALQSAYDAALDQPDKARLKALWASFIAAGLCDADGVVCTIDGDLALTRASLTDEMRFRSGVVASAKNTDDQSSLELTINLYRSARDIWPNELRTLTYFIAADSFEGARGAPNAVAVVRKALEEAIGDWESACDFCGLDFSETSDVDAAAFHVAYDNSIGQHALSFFPHQALNRERTRLKKGQKLRISEKFFGPTPNGENVPSGYGQPWDLQSTDAAGRTKRVRFGISQAFVLRHELGHILGYRHEFVMAAPDNPGFAGCEEFAKNERGFRAELVDAVNGRADVYSVMMYPCARYYADRARGKNDLTYDFNNRLSDCDKTLHQAMYSLAGGFNPGECETYDGARQ